MSPCRWSLPAPPTPSSGREAELHAVGLGDRLEHYPAELSGGEQQRVAIARALSPNPAILLADEPSGNLDAGNGAMIADLLFKANAERGMTLVLVTHDTALAERSGRVVRLNSGRIVEEEVSLSGQGGPRCSRTSCPTPRSLSRSPSGLHI